jgi:hypothetical protein
MVFDIGWRAFINPMHNTTFGAAIHSLMTAAQIGLEQS